MRFTNHHAPITSTTRKNNPHNMPQGFAVIGAAAGLAATSAAAASPVNPYAVKKHVAIRNLLRNCITAIS
jgi:hypothetical protein